MVKIGFIHRGYMQSISHLVTRVISAAYQSNVRRNRFNLLGVAVLWAVTITGAAAQVRPPIPLPADPSAAVIVLDDATQSGYGSCVLPRQPFLTIRADGSVLVVNSCANAVVGRGVLKPEELQELLRFAIEDQGFFSFDPAGSYKPLRPELENLTIEVSHAKVTVLTIQTADRRHQTRVDLSSVREPSVQFDALEKRLLRLAEETKAGGKERVADALDHANEYLAQERRELRPFTIEDFRSAQQTGANQAEFVFYRVVDDGTRWQQAVVANVAGQQPRVRVTTDIVETDTDLLEYLRELVIRRSVQ
jgi:hypothetical protein